MFLCILNMLCMERIILSPNSVVLAPIVSEIEVFKRTGGQADKRTNGQTDMATSS